MVSLSLVVGGLNRLWSRGRVVVVCSEVDSDETSEVVGEGEIIISCAYRFSSFNFHDLLLFNDLPSPPTPDQSQALTNTST